MTRAWKEKNKIGMHIRVDTTTYRGASRPLFILTSWIPRYLNPSLSRYPIGPLFLQGNSVILQSIELHNNISIECYREPDRNHRNFWQAPEAQNSNGEENQPIHASPLRLVHLPHLYRRLRCRCVCPSVTTFAIPFPALAFLKVFPIIIPIN